MNERDIKLSILHEVMEQILSTLRSNVEREFEATLAKNIRSVTQW